MRMVSLCFYDFLYHSHHRPTIVLNIKSQSTNDARWRLTRLSFQSEQLNFNIMYVRISPTIHPDLSLYVLVAPVKNVWRSNEKSFIFALSFPMRNFILSNEWQMYDVRRILCCVNDGVLLYYFHIIESIDWNIHVGMKHEPIKKN